MTLNQIAALAADTTFQSQIRAAALGQAASVLAEAVPGNTIVENARQKLAQDTITDGCMALLTRFVWAIAATPGFSAIVNDSADQNDAAIASAMVSQWDNLALVTNFMQAQTNP